MPTDFTRHPDNAAVVKAFHHAKRELDGAYQMPSYAAIQVLAAAIEAVGEDPTHVADLHQHQFDTVIGQVEYDSKGDLKNFDFAVYQWDKNGNRKPL